MRATKFTLVVLALCVSSLFVSVDGRRGSSGGRRGRSEEVDDEMEDEGFVCDYRTKSIPHSWVNDDVCDCKDGTDEPRTSACSATRLGKAFRCENKGARPKMLFTSRIDDGVCDCCDGSDEKKGVCANTCKEEQARYAEEAQRQYQLVMEGHAKRKAAEVEAQHLVESWERELAAEKASRHGIEKLTMRLKMLVAREESHEAGERFSWARGARRRALEDAIEKERSQWDMDKPQTSAQRHAGAAERGEAKGEEEEDEIRRREERLGVRSESRQGKGRGKASSESSGPDGVGRVLDVEVTLSNRTMRLRDYLEEEDRLISGKSKPVPPTIDQIRRERTLFAGLLQQRDGWTDLAAAVFQLTGAVFLSPVQAATWGLSSSISAVRQQLLPSPLLDAVEGEEKRLREEEGERPWWLPSLPSALRPLEWALEHMWDGPGLAYAYFFPSSVTGYERLEAALMRRALAAAEEEMAAQDRHLTALAQRGSEADYGPQRVFLTWRDRCFDARDKDYGYKICAFKDAKQGSVLVGRWGHWASRSSIEAAQRAAELAGKATARAPPSDYSRMLFHGGQKCYNGPPRSVELTLECSPEEAIIEVTEPSICVYDMVMRTPLACDDRLVKKAAKRVKELEAALTTNTESQAGRTEPPPSDSKDEL